MRVPPNFDRVGRPYRFLEYLTLGHTLTRTRTTYLPELSRSRFALILGDGDGRFLAKLLRSNPQLHATVIDSSGVMLRLLTERCAFAANRLTIHHADALNAIARPAPPTFDLVATHFFLDCFTESDLARLVPSIRAHLLPGALWVLSDFRIPPSGPLRLPARLLVRSLYLAFRLLTGLEPTRLPNHAGALLHAGLIPIGTRHRFGGLLTAELWQLPAITPPVANPGKLVVL